MQWPRAPAPEVGDAVSPRLGDDLGLCTTPPWCETSKTIVRGPRADDWRSMTGADRGPSHGGSANGIDPSWGGREAVGRTGVIIEVVAMDTVPCRGSGGWLHPGPGAQARQRECSARGAPRGAPGPRSRHRGPLRPPSRVAKHTGPGSRYIRGVTSTTARWARPSARPSIGLGCGLTGGSPCTACATTTPRCSSPRGSTWCS